MIIPFSTDAPVYHWPVSTVVLIVVNVAAYIAMDTGALSDEAVQGLILQFGTGLHPTQWLTTHFVHGGLLHLLGNMMFLWPFGLVVEGKVGWLRFLAIYLGIGVGYGFLLQLSTLWLHNGGALGASAAIFGLVAISLVWAPENEMRIFYWFIRPGITSLRIRTLSFCYLALELSFALLDWAGGDLVGSSVLHLIGAAVGLPVGVILLKKGLVDCEGWDIFSRRQKRLRPWTGRRSEVKTAAAAPASEIPGKNVPTASEQRNDALVLVRDHLQSRDVLAAKMVYQETVKETGPWPVPAADLSNLIKGLLKAGLNEECLP